MQITRELAQKVDTVVQAGLTAGLGVPKLGEMCVEAAVCYALGEAHSDKPSCVGAAVRMFKIHLNDSPWWGTTTQRAAGMRRLAIAQLGSDTLNQQEFTRRSTLAVIQRIIAEMARKHGWETEAQACESATTLTQARAAALMVRKKADAAAAADAADAATYAADAAANAADADANAAAYAADAAAYAADAAANAADADANALSVLQTTATLVVDILIDMRSPGTAYLDLIEAA